MRARPDLPTFSANRLQFQFPSADATDADIQAERRRWVPVMRAMNIELS
jgi:hypothetical protein